MTAIARLITKKSEAILRQGGRKLSLKGRHVDTATEIAAETSKKHSGKKRDFFLTPLNKRVLNLSYILGVISGFIILPMLTITISADVVMRYVFGAPIHGANEVSAHLLLVFYVFALSYVYAENGHVRMDLLYENMSSRMRSLVDVLAGICGFIVFGAIAYQANDDIKYARLIGQSTEDVGLLIWPFYAVIMITFAFVLLQILVSTLLRLFNLQANPDTHRLTEV